MPASTVMTVPVMLRAASLMREADRFGNVFDFGQPLQGAALRNLLALLAVEAARHVGGDEARRHGIDRDAGPADLAGE